MGCEHAWQVYQESFARLRDGPSVGAQTRQTVTRWVDFLDTNKDAFVESCKQTAEAEGIPECAASPITFRRFLVVARPFMRRHVGFQLTQAFESAIAQQFARVSPSLVAECERRQPTPDERMRATIQREVTDRVIREELERDRLLRPTQAEASEERREIAERLRNAGFRSLASGVESGQAPIEVARRWKETLESARRF